MRDQHKRMVDTRRLYMYEHVTDRMGFGSHLTKPRSEKYLQRLAGLVWEKHGRSKMGVPKIKVVDGAAWSFCLGYSDITLATNKNTRGNLPHNTVEVALHELTHAMGFFTHGKNFVRKYRQLLVEYGKCEEVKLLLAMSLFKIKH